MRKKRTALRAVRRRLQLTQADLARLSGLTRTTIIRLEQDASRVNTSTVHKLAEGLDVDPVWLGDVLAGRIDPLRPVRPPAVRAVA